MMSIAYDYEREAMPAIASAKPRLLLIDGRHVPSASGRTFKTFNPANEQVIATVAEGNEADVDRAVAARARCSPPSAKSWSGPESACRRASVRSSKILRRNS